MTRSEAMAGPTSLRNFAFQAAADAVFAALRFIPEARLRFGPPRLKGASLIALPRLSPVIALLGLAACVSGPELEVASEGRLPVGTTPSFAVDISEPAGPHAQAASNAVSGALRARGWQPGTAAQWRIEALYVERPGFLGAFVEEAAPVEPEGWRIRPTPRRWWRRDGGVGVLTLRMIDAATGAEVVHAEAKRRIDGQSTEAELDRLATALVAEALSDDQASAAPR